MGKNFSPFITPIITVRLNPKFRIKSFSKITVHFTEMYFAERHYAERDLSEWTIRRRT